MLSSSEHDEVHSTRRKMLHFINYASEKVIYRREKERYVYIDPDSSKRLIVKRKYDIDIV